MSLSVHRSTLGLCLVSALLLSSLAAAPAGAADGIGREPYRPAYHYTPERNWMNDPNGLVYHDGVYHLYYQHNPHASTWGNMSWGHATSPDLVTWVEQPLAIPQTFDESGSSVEDIFSGSIVVDESNTSGLGTAENPPLVALYTSYYPDAHPTLAGIQAQSVAYSLDGGYTWAKYQGNPVLDRGSANFRDPKVFRYQTATGGSYWVMVAVEALERKVVIYRSDNLIDWTFLSTFGPANAVGGIWEVPDLFPMTVKQTGETKWVMIVNLNPGSPAGGSGAQYFVGDFNGVTFTSDTLVSGEEDVAGSVLEDFEFDSWAGSGWRVSNEAGNDVNGPFGDGPQSGTWGGQQEVTGYRGERLVNSFVGEDWPVGTMTSSSFTVERPWLNLLVGGGDNPHVEGTQLANDPPPGAVLWNGFEVADGQNLADLGWTGTGDLQAADSPAHSGGDYSIGAARINTWAGGPNGDDNRGTLTSPEFTLDGDHVSFLIGGGRERAGVLQLQLLIDGEIVRTAGGNDAGALQWASWDVSEFRGRGATLRIVDDATGGWGHLTLDHVVVGDEPAVPRSSETTVNLVVNGEIVRSATGNGSETLDWESWNVSEFVGQQAELLVIDNNRFGWGHLLLDDIVASDAPQPRRIDAYDWVDWGPDHYAAISFANMPDNRRVMIAWMNDWRYANSIPTAPWRSANTLPREFSLELIDGDYELRQAPVRELRALEQTRGRLVRRNVQVNDRALALPFSGDAYKLEVRLDPGDATRAGVAVRTAKDYALDSGEGTFVGFDTVSQRMVIDRSRAGDSSFAAQFADAASAPLINPDGTLTLTVYVDRSSVEAFGEQGLRAITSQVFPDASSLGLSLVSDGGTARFVSVVATPLRRSVHTGVQPMEAVVISNSCRSGATVKVTNPTKQRQTVRLTSIAGQRNLTLSRGQTATVRLRGPASHAAGSLSVAAQARPSQQTSWTSVSMPACS